MSAAEKKRAKTPADKEIRSTDRGRLLIERSSVIAQNNPNAPLPKPPAGGSGSVRPLGSGNGTTAVTK